MVSRVTGWDEYIRHEENALTVPLDDERQAVEAVRRLVADEPLRRRLSQEGLRTARAMDWSARCPMFEGALQRIVERRQGSRSEPQHRANRGLLKVIEQQAKLASLDELAAHPSVAKGLRRLAALATDVKRRLRGRGHDS